MFFSSNLKCSFHIKLHNVFRVLLMALSHNITEQQVIFVMENEMFVTVLQNVPQNKLYL